MFIVLINDNWLGCKMFLRIVFGFYLIVHVGATQVTLHADSTEVSPGQSIYLTCNHDNNPIVTWWVNGNNVLSAMVNGGDCMFSPAAVPSYLTGCSCANLLHTCTLQYLTEPSEQWQCSISVRGDLQKSNNVTLEVADPTEKIACTIGQVPVSPGIIQVVRDEALHMNCSCDSNPPPIYTWFMPNGSVSIGALLSLPSVQSIGNNSYTMQAVSNIHGTSLEKTFIFNIEFPPMLPVLYWDLTESFAKTNRINVLRGQHVSMRCQAESNPDPSYEWYLQGNKATNGEIWNGTILNDTSIECNVTNTMNPTGRSPVTTSRTSSALILANYPPENLTLTFMACGTSVETNYLKVVEGNSVNGTCATVSKPSPTYSWTPDTYGHGERFFINKANRSHHATYTCNAEYILNTTFDGIINQTFQSTFQLETLAPVKVYGINDTICLLNENMSVKCPYTAGNPRLTSFEWFKLNCSEIISTNETLTLTYIQRTDEGNYTCKVNNTLDPTGCNAEIFFDETTFYVDVQYAANITKYYAVGYEVKSAVAVVENQTISLICEADSDPIATLEIVNISNGNEHSLTQSENNTITYDIENTSCEYPTRLYQCNCRNVHNTEPEMREIKLVILCAPRASPFAPLITTVMGKINSSAILRFTFIASPPPSDSSAFVWRKKNGTDWVRLHTTDIIKIDISDDNLHTSLSILHLQRDDFATYCVSVQNQIGSVEQEFSIRAMEKPAVPEGFRVFVSQSGLTVVWIPGFDGGENQQFVIGYKQEADTNWTFTTESGGVTRMTLDRLVPGTTYTVKMYAENTVGKSDDTDVITVETQVKEHEDAANITKYYVVGFEVKQTVAVVENQAISLICEADGDPIATLEIVNISNGDEHSLTQSENNRITYDIENTNCEYPTGVYQCKCRNVHNTEPEMREIKIVILCAPRASPFAPLITTVMGKINSSAILSFTVIASPPPSDSSAFVWRKKNGTDWMRLHTTNNIQIDISDDNLHTSLSILHLQRDDFATYCVRVQNQLGSAEHEFFIGAIEKPAVPEGFRVFVSQSGLTVVWKPGFDGGENQQFVIGYKQEADTNWTYTTESGGVTRMTLDRLIPGTTYTVKMYAENTVGKSEDTDVITVETQVEEHEEGGNSASISVIVGSVGGAVGGLAIMVVLFIMLKRSKYGCPKKSLQMNGQHAPQGKEYYKLRDSTSDKDASSGSDASDYSIIIIPAP